MPVLKLGTPGKIGRLADPHESFWRITSFLSSHPNYRQVPLSGIRIVQEAVARGNYCCLTEGKTIRAVATWRPIDADTVRRVYPDHAAKSSGPLDGILLTSLAAIDRASLKIVIDRLRKSFSDKNVYWDRHDGKLGHRSGKARE